jgi:hypothetical protein
MLSWCNRSFRDFCGKAIHYNVKVDVNSGSFFQPNSFVVAAHLDILYHRIVGYPVKNPDAAIGNIVMRDMRASWQFLARLPDEKLSSWRRSPLRCWH